MTPADVEDEFTIRPASARNDEHAAFRLLPIMRQGIGSSIPETSLSPQQPKMTTMES